METSGEVFFEKAQLDSISEIRNYFTSDGNTFCFLTDNLRYDVELGQPPEQPADFFRISFDIIRPNNAPSAVELDVYDMEKYGPVRTFVDTAWELRETMKETRKNEILYIPCIQLDSSRPDYLSTIDVDPKSKTFSKVYRFFSKYF